MDPLKQFPRTGVINLFYRQKVHCAHYKSFFFAVVLIEEKYRFIQFVPVNLFNR